MPKFRKRPIIIDAFLWTGENPTALGMWRAQWPREFADFHICENRELEVRTLEDGEPSFWRRLFGLGPRAKHVASRGDWIIRGVGGEFYPCKPDIFAATYEPVENYCGGGLNGLQQ